MHYCTTTTLPVFLNPLAGIDKLRRRRRRRVSGGMGRGCRVKIPRSLAPSFDTTLVILLITTTMIATALLVLFYVGRRTLIHGNTGKWLAFER